MRLFCIIVLLSINICGFSQTKLILKKGLRKVQLNTGMSFIPILKSDTISKIDWTKKCQYDGYTKKDSIWTLTELTQKEADILLTFTRPQCYVLDTIKAQFFYDMRLKERMIWQKNKTFMSSFVDSSFTGYQVYKCIQDWETHTHALKDMNVLLFPKTQTCECSQVNDASGPVVLGLSMMASYVAYQEKNIKQKIMMAVAAVGGILIGTTMMLPEKVDTYYMEEWSLVKLK